jgi:[ribosomal protein S5]-alanine N-acetyltransferase
MAPKKKKNNRRRRAIQSGERVFLFRPAARDEAEYLALRKKSSAFLRHWEPRISQRTDQKTAFNRMLLANRTHRFEKLLICSVLDESILGYIAINEIIHGAFQCGYLGYWVGAAYARQRYMTEALDLMLRHAFVTLGLHRVEANIISANLPSIRLAIRAGFRKEGLSKSYLEIESRWQDHERWALLSEEWLSSQKFEH